MADYREYHLTDSEEKLERKRAAARLRQQRCRARKRAAAAAAMGKETPITKKARSKNPSHGKASTTETTAAAPFVPMSRPLLISTNTASPVAAKRIQSSPVSKHKQAPNSSKSKKSGGSSVLTVKRKGERITQDILTTPMNTGRLFELNAEEEGVGSNSTTPLPLTDGSLTKTASSSKTAPTTTAPSRAHNPYWVPWYPQAPPFFPHSHAGAPWMLPPPPHAIPPSASSTLRPPSKEKNDSSSKGSKPKEEREDNEESNFSYTPLVDSSTMIPLPPVTSTPKGPHYLSGQDVLSFSGPDHEPISFASPLYSSQTLRMSNASSLPEATPIKKSTDLGLEMFGFD